MSGNGFVIAGDGWVQVTPCGEFPHSGAGVTQVVDREACDRIAAEFNGRKADPNFPGVLVDFDHFSLDTDKSSEAAGWITELEARVTGLWARVRWSDSGLAAVQGGRFRLVSPVFPAPDACEDLGSGRIRPVKLVSVALTNEPNIKGARPIANRKPVGSDEGARGDAEALSGNDEPKGNVMSGPGAKKFMWLLGDPPKGPHCGECASRNGQVKTLLEWLRMPAPMCHCYCRLAEVGKDVPEGYDPTAVTLNLGNRWSDAARSASLAARRAKYGSGWGPSKGWSDAARAASLAVRREKAAARQAALTALGGTYSDGTPVIRDVTAGFDDYEPGQTTISDAAPFEERQRQYEQAFREWWNGVETTAGNIDKFNEFVAAFAGMAAAAAGSSSPAGAASRAFGVGGTRAGQPKARRGALSRAWDGMRDALKRLGEEPVTDEAVVAVERAKAEFKARRTAEGSALAEAIRRIDPNAPAGLENFAVSQLRDYLRRLGGDPGKAAPRDSGPETFDALRAKYGVPVSKLKAPAKNAPKPSPAEIRESLAEYLMETLGHRPGNVDQNLGDLKAQTGAAARGVARAKETALRAQREASLARSMFGEGSPEHAKAVKAAEGATWDYEHATRVSDRISGEYLSLKRNLDQFLERVREGGPIDWGPAEADYNALLESARRAAPLGNRWSDAARDAARASSQANGWGGGGWSDAARAASLAVRRAKAALRSAGDYLRRGGADTPAKESGETGESDSATEKKPYSGPGSVSSAAWSAGKELFEERNGRKPDSRKDSKEIRALGREWEKRQKEADPAGASVMAAMRSRYEDFGKRLAASGGSHDGAVAAAVHYLAGRYADGHGIDHADVMVLAEAVEADRSLSPVEKGKLKDKLWDVSYAKTYFRGDNGFRLKDGAPVAEYPDGEVDRFKSKNAYDALMGVVWALKGTGKMKNRWSDSARAAARASRKANGNYTGWTDAARAASLAVRRAKADARASSGGGSGGYPGDYFTYDDGTPVIRDVTAGFDDYEPGRTTISDAAPFEERQRQYAEAFRQWWSGVETSAGNIEKFHAFVAAFGGAAAAAAGAARPAGEATGLFGATGGRYGGQKPVYDQSGNVVGWAKVGGRPAAARRGSKSAREVVTSDPLNNPKTPADLAVRESYDSHLANVRRGYEAEMAAKGLDPQGYPLAGSGALRSLVPAAAAEAIELYGRLAEMPVRTAEDREAYEAAAEGLRRFGDLYDSDMLERAEREGILPKVRALLDGENLDGQPRGSSSTRESATDYPEEDLPWFATPPGVVKESASPYGGGLSANAAREAARALGVLHGAYGVGEDGVEIPEALRGEYELGRAEGAKGYDYGVVPPKDRVAVLRGAQAYLEGAVGEDDGYTPDHLNDRYNLADWDSAASWATRNQGKNGVYDPRTPDTRGQYNPASLMRTAMEWFRDAMVRGDRGESDAALSYMGDLLVSVSSDRRAAVDAVRGGSDEGVEDGEEAEIDATMPEYDADGVEVGGEPFFEDSYADPNALPPWWRLLGNRWSDAARAAALAVRRAKAGAGKAAAGATGSGVPRSRITRPKIRRPVTGGGEWNILPIPRLPRSPAIGGGEWHILPVPRSPYLPPRLFNRWSDAARAAARASRKANGWGGGWSDAARAAALAVRRAKSAARKAAEAAQVAGPADQLPLAHPGFGAADDALEDYLKRKRRHEANEARKAADKDRLQDEREERRRKRNLSLKEKFDEPGLREKFEQPGLREKFQEANDKVDRERLKDKYAKSNPVVPAQGFSVPVKGAVFYYNGNFYDDKGNWVAKAKPSRKSGAVWQNGLWYDAATGKTLGRTVAAS